ncbi:hypothetical protein Athai_26600 [Actinocatenispora thailandica]|uniref:Serine hydroxymethyltransferase-like domain-containing protein n=1 Tax=Actinocatenispora thailandica TaxID=227318 RepID=A0A7R7DP29_9ACTN|nr:hypothetical protein Athai_26600 [Actinocatenispora thailandica]
MSALHDTDPQLAGLVDAERRRQFDVLRLIPSENYVSPRCSPRPARC